jgi:hypothetical protein
MMKKYGAAYRLVILVLLLILCASAMVSGSPLNGGNQVSVAPEFTPKQVKLANGTAECVRTAWIGDVYNRTVICVEWRLIKQESK